MFNYIRFKRVVQPTYVINSNELIFSYSVLNPFGVIDLKININAETITISKSDHTHTELNSKLKLNKVTVQDHIAKKGISHNETKASLGLPNFINCIPFTESNFNSTNKNVLLTNLEIKNSCLTTTGLLANQILTIVDHTLPEIDASNIIGIVASGEGISYTGVLNLIRDYELNFRNTITVATNTNRYISNNLFLRNNSTNNCELINLNNKLQIKAAGSVSLNYVFNKSNITASILNMECEFITDVVNFPITNLSLKYSYFSQSMSNVNAISLSAISTPIMNVTDLAPVSTIGTSITYLFKNTVNNLAISNMNIYNTPLLTLDFKNLVSTNLLIVDSCKVFDFIRDGVVESVNIIENSGLNNKYIDVENIPNTLLGSGYFKNTTVCTVFIPSYNIEQIKYFSNNMIISTNSNNTEFYIKYMNDLYTINNFENIVYNFNGALADIRINQAINTNQMNNSSTAWLYGNILASTSEPTIIDVLPLYRAGRSLEPDYERLVNSTTIGLYGRGTDFSTVTIYNSNNMTTPMNTAIVGIDNLWYSTITLSTSTDINNLVVV
jgi:hypothetical protein